MLRFCSCGCAQWGHGENGGFRGTDGEGSRKQDGRTKKHSIVKLSSGQVGLTETDLELDLHVDQGLAVVDLVRDVPEDGGSR